jgi:hypothetical protein
LTLGLEKKQEQCKKMKKSTRILITSFVSVLLIGSHTVCAEDALFRVIYRDKEDIFIIYQDTQTGCEYIAYRFSKERSITPRIHGFSAKPICGAIKPNVDEFLQKKDSK